MRKVDLLKEWWIQNLEFFNGLKLRSQLHGNLSDAHTLPQRVLAESEPIFVLSTGRAGTMLLTKVFEEVRGLEVYHEPEPDLLYAGKYAYQNPSDLGFSKGAVLGGRYDLIRNSFVKNKRYVETNNRITFLAYGLADLFPKARFIHLVRNPESFVRSGMQRGWYTGKTITDEGRITPSDSGFSNWNQADKLTWLWNATNEYCENFKEKYPERTYTILSEDLFRSSAEVNSLLLWLNLGKLEISRLEKLIATKVNQGKSTADQLDYNSELVPTAKKYY